MIERYCDHAANERTYLAWIRTSIAILAFGFLIEKFHYFIEYINGSEKGMHIDEIKGAEEVGIALVAISIAIIILSSWRFYVMRRKIKSRNQQQYGGRSSIALTVLLVLIGLFVFAYLAHIL